MASSHFILIRGSKRMSKNSLVPEDLLLEILSRLPVKSVVRFTCVCKQWSSIIQTDSFVTKHLSSSHNKDIHVLLAPQPLATSISLCSYPSFEAEKRIQLPPPYMLSRSILFLGSCDGIVCLKIEQVDYTCVLALWNPAMMEFKVILVRKHEEDRDGYMDASIGFDPATMDYKVISYIAYAPASGKESIQKLNVYSLRKGSWRTVDDQGLGGVLNHDNAIFCCSSSDRNMVSWLATSIIRWDFNWKLISFNVSNETFLETPLPSSPKCGIWSQRYGITYLDTIRGCKVFGWPVACECEHPCTIDLWNLEEYGNARSWTRLLSLRLTPDPKILNAWSRLLWNGRELMFIHKPTETEDRFELASYDPENRRVRTLHELDTSRMVMFKESLVPIK